MKRSLHNLCPVNPDVRRQTRIDANRPGPGTALHRLIKMDNLAVTVHAAVCSAGTMHTDWLLGDLGQRSFENVLNSGAVVPNRL